MSFLNPISSLIKTFHHGPSTLDNYFNYFTEIERYFQSKRESFTLLSTLDWVLIENWKDQEIPLELILKGMDRAFSRSKRNVSSLSYCTKAISEVVNEQKHLRTETPNLPEFSIDEVTEYLNKLADQITLLRETFPEFESRFKQITDSIRKQDGADLQVTERILNTLEEKLISIIRIASDESVLIDLKKAVESSLKPFRRTMTVEQLSMLEQQFSKRKLMEHYNVPRLSLFYLI